MNLIDIHSILKPVIEQPSIITVSEYIDNVDGTYTAVTTNTEYIRNPKTVSINGNNYRVVSFVENTSILLYGSSLPTGDITLYTPKYWHGTITQTNNERVNIPNKSEETPFVYFAETYTEDYGDLKGDLVDIPVRLFFLDESNFEDYNTENYYDIVITPMRNLCASIVDRIYLESCVLNIKDIRITNHTRFATFLDSKGYERNIMSETLSGVELSATLKVRRKTCCGNN